MEEQKFSQYQENLIRGIIYSEIQGMKASLGIYDDPSLLVSPTLRDLIEEQERLGRHIHILRKELDILKERVGPIITRHNDLTSARNLINE